ncbi:bL21 family ribosomal protein [Wolbachia pipientis]|uniref:bL21 family ribosomal protein n=1 Tax=Wolbachia pipientis TaxID=955 RepID=UPI00068A3DA7
MFAVIETGGKQYLVKEGSIIKVEKLEAEEKNGKLKDKSKTTEQPKQGNGARYTATVGMGLAAGLIAFTALERTVKLEMLVMIGIAVASALVAGGITYAVLPSTQVDGAKAQEVNENGKKK